MSEARKEFDCPRCGGKSWLNPATLLVEHSEPKCAAWLEVEQRGPEPPKRADEVTPVSGTFVVPTVVDFDCPECHRPARMFPREHPIAVQHSLPLCKLYEAIEAKKDDVERFLIKAGVHIHVPERS